MCVNQDVLGKHAFKKTQFSHVRNKTIIQPG